MTPRTIPEIRARLFEISRDLIDYATEAEFFAARVATLAAEVVALAEETKRRPAVRRSPVRARRMTPELKAKAQALAAAHPEMPYREIGDLLGLDGGRVSEATAGKRGEQEVRP
jgi:hypothetical protein